MSAKNARKSKRAKNAGIIGGISAVVIVILAFIGQWLFTGWAWDVWTWLQMLVLAVTLGLVVYGFVFALIGNDGAPPAPPKDKPVDDN